MVFAVDPYSLRSITTGGYDESKSPEARNARPFVNLRVRPRAEATRSVAATSSEVPDLAPPIDPPAENPPVTEPRKTPQPESDPPPPRSPGEPPHPEPPAGDPPAPPTPHKPPVSEPPKTS
jgi:hypothetical protein